MTVAEFQAAIEAYSRRVDAGEEFSPDDYLEIGRLWNTLGHYTTLQSTEPGARFYQQVRDELIPPMVQALGMTVGRGYSFHSEAHDFMLGGIPDPRFRHHLTDAEASDGA